MILMMKKYLLLNNNIKYIHGKHVHVVFN